MSLFRRKLDSLKWKVSLWLHGKLSVLFGEIITFHRRPLRSIDIKSKSNNHISCEELGIVIQGPLHQSQDFELETVKLYKKLYPQAKIIVSTWKDQDKSSLRKLEEAGAILNLCDLPENFGVYNVNLQIASTVSGLKKAKELGVKYLIKTRADQRLYRYDIFPYLKSLLKTFPVKDGNLNSRLITSSFGTCKFRTYGMSDFFMFGETEDMLKYWDAPFYDEGIKEYLELDNGQKPPILGGVPIVAEIYLCVNFLERMRMKPDWSLDQYWELIKKYFVVVDGVSLDIYWDKYFKMTEYRYTRVYHNTNHRSMEFADWIQLVSGEDITSWEETRVPEKWQRVDGKLEVVNL